MLMSTTERDVLAPAELADAIAEKEAEVKKARAAGE